MNDDYIPSSSRFAVDSYRSYRHAMFVYDPTIVFLKTNKLAALVVMAILQISEVSGGLISLIQNNALGRPDYYKTQSWPFDPDVSARRAPEFIALHGNKSEKLIERIGLGVNGRQYEHREQQLVRDFMFDKQQQQQQQQSSQNFVGANDYNYQQLQQQSNFLRIPIPQS
ncbi:Hypothetical protein CINCED_3A012723 [Cinara cedri]|uniref:Uncharacterized protein n=1 Tax=Cinara cedri TaxID=506608 RepID=A0A5E4NBI1_9HEMI|nr:Hypothetical protein CINCED_3A012723 [Cinara cedri]